MRPDGMDYTKPALHEDPEKRNIYHIQDHDRPVFVLAKSYPEALRKWEAMVAAENECHPYELDAPSGISLIAEYGEVLV